VSSYLRFFELERSPFEGKAQSQVVLGTRALRDAFGMIEQGLADGASRICVSGGPGLGKTSLARALPKLLGNETRVAVMLDPSISWEASRESLARQWGLAGGQLSRAALVEAANERRLVLTIDQAERASEEFLDHLDVLLSFRSAEDEPVVQSILLARLASPGDASASPLLWWLDRIQTLQLEFAPMPRDGVESYIHKHLKRAGWRGEHLFDEAAAHAIHEYSGGVPGSISELCETLLVEAAECGVTSIDDEFVRSVCEPDELSEADANVPPNTESSTPEDADGEWTFAGQFEDVTEDTPATNAFAVEAVNEATETEEPADDESACEASTSENGEESEVSEASESLEAAGVDAPEATDTQAAEPAEDDALSLDAESEADQSATDGPALTPNMDVDEAALAEALEFFEAAAATDASYDTASAAAGESEIELDQVASDSVDSETDSETDEEEAPPNEVYADAEDADAEMDAAFTPADEDEWPETDDDFDEDDAALLAPPTDAELRAIRGGGVSRLLRPLSLAAIAAVIGGLGFAFLGGSEETPTQAGRSTGIAHSKPSSTASPLVSKTVTTETHRADSGTPTSTKPLMLVQPAGGFVNEKEAAPLAATKPNPFASPSEPVALGEPAEGKNEPVLLTEAFEEVLATNQAEGDGPTVLIQPESRLQEKPEALPAAPSMDPLGTL